MVMDGPVERSVFSALLVLPSYCNVPDFDSHYVLCITVWEFNSGKFLDPVSAGLVLEDEDRCTHHGVRS